MGFQGSKYTWLNKCFKNKGALILERLDHIFANNDWLLNYPNAQVIHLPRTHSDHCPLLLQLDRVGPTNNTTLFHFEIMWTSHLEFPNLVKRVWDSSPTLLDVIKHFESEASS